MLVVAAICQDDLHWVVFINAQKRSFYPLSLACSWNVTVAYFDIHYYLLHVHDLEVMDIKKWFKRYVH